METTQGGGTADDGGRQGAPPRRPARLTRFMNTVRWAATGSRRRVAWTVVGAATVATLGFGSLGRQPCLDVPGARPWELAKKGMTRLELADVQGAAQVLRSWERKCARPDATVQSSSTVQPGKQAAVNAPQEAYDSIAWDNWLIPSYAIALALTILLIALSLDAAASRILGALGAIMVLLAAVVDYLENYSLKRILHDGAGSEFLLLAQVLGLIKWGLLIAGPAFLLFAWSSHLVRRYMLTESGNYTDPRTDRSVSGRLKRQMRTWSRQLSGRDRDPIACDLPGAVGAAPSIDTVLQEELKYLRHHRHDHPVGHQAYAGVGRRLVGLALSGGGIRSATTNLGLLQALADLRILPFVDYLSTVSGGGYIGSAFSSLLSISAQKLAGVPAETLPDNFHEFSNGDTPRFSTVWKNFPFRDDFIGASQPVAGQPAPLNGPTPTDDSSARLSNNILAHLRTHGSFLVARRGLFSRDAMRAIGNIVTGVVWNLVGFLLALAILSALYVAATHSLVPRLREQFEAIPATHYASPTFTALQTDTVLRSSWELRCEQTSDTTCRVRGTALIANPGLGPTIRNNLKVAWEPVRLAYHRPTEEGAHFATILGAAVIAGVVLTLIAWLVIGVFPHLMNPGDEQPMPVPGESYEEMVDNGILRSLAILAFVWISMWTITLRFGLLGHTSVLVILWIPFVVLLGARVATVIIAVVRPQWDGWNTRFRSLWSAHQTTMIYGLWLSAAFIVLAPLMFAFAAHKLGASIGGVAALLSARMLTPNRMMGASKRMQLPPAVMHALLALAVLLAVALGVILFAALLIGMQQPQPYWQIALAGILVLGLLGIVVDHNKLSPHYFYRDRLAETYLLSELPDNDRRLWNFRDATEMKLTELHGVDASGDKPVAAEGWKNAAPYHLISAAINLAGSRDLTRKDRKSGYFLFSKLYCGSTHTGFRPTAVYRDGETRLGRAVAISGAAASSAMGFRTFFAQAFATVLFNVRLGYWLENPSFSRSQHLEEERVWWPWYLWREITMATNERTALVNLSDGGHTGDNVGIYPLFQRRCKVIIAMDAEQDPNLTFGSFTEALRHAYIDLGIRVDIDLSMIRPDPTTGRSKSHCAVGRIRYPDRPNQTSYLIYMKNSLTGDEQEAVLNYKVACPDFPHETTADQFFDDAQFESYRALGVHITKATFGSWSGTRAFDAPFIFHTPDELLNMAPKPGQATYAGT